MTVRSRLAVLVTLGAALPSLALAQAYPPTYPQPTGQQPAAQPPQQPAQQPPPAYPPPQQPAPPPVYPPQQQYQQPRPPPPPQQARLELTAIAGYQVNSDVQWSTGELVVDDTPLYGIVLGVLARPGSRAELMWLYSDPSAKVSGLPEFAGAESFKVATHYFQIGGSQSIVRGKLEPFFGGTLGAVLYMPDDFKVGGKSYDYGDTWRFAFTLGGGLKVHLSPKVLLRLEIRVAAPVYFYGGGVYVGSGGGGVSVSGGIPIWQWGFQAGLGFKP